MTRASGRRWAAVRLTFLMTAILLHSSGVASGEVRAFPEAEGFGANKCASGIFGAKDPGGCAEHCALRSFCGWLVHVSCEVA